MAVRRTLGAALSRRRALRGSRGFITLGTAGVVIAASLVLAFGVPARSTLLRLLSGHGWIASSRPDQVMLANGETGRLDFRMTLGSSGQAIDVVQSGQHALLVNQTTGETGSIDLGTLKVNQTHSVAPTGSLGTPEQVTATNQVIPGPDGDFYLVHRRSGQIDLINALSNATVAHITVGTGLSDAIVDSTGTLWVEHSNTGTLYGIRYANSTLHMSNVRSSVVAPRDTVELSSVNGNLAVLDRTKGTFFMAARGVPGPAVTLPTHLGASAHLASAVSGSVVPLSSPGKVVLIKKQVASVVALNGRSGNALGNPIPFDQKIFVPDLTTGNVVVLNDTGVQVGTPIPPKSGGHAPTLTADVQNGSLFINNPASRVAFSVTSSGRIHQVNKVTPQVPTTKPTTPPPTGPVHNPTQAVLPIVQPTLANPTGKGGPTVAASVPGAPGSATARAGSKAATITWTPATPHGSAVTKYTVSWTAGGGGSQTVGGNQTSLTVNGLTNGMPYAFSVSAFNAVGQGPAAKTTAITPTSTIPDPPASVTAKALRSGSIGVSWNAANGEGHSISYYTVTAKAAGSTPLPPLKVTGLTASLSITQGIEVGQAYIFSVTATNNVGGTSAPSTPTAAVTASTTPQAVAGLTATVSNGTVTVSWSCSATCASGSPLTYFTVALTPAASGTPLKVTAIAGQSSYHATVSGVGGDTSLTITVTAYNRAWGSGQPTTFTAIIKGHPTAAPAMSWNGLTLSVFPHVTSHGSTVTACALHLTGPGGPYAATGNCTTLSLGVAYYNVPFSGTLIVHTDEFGTTAANSISTSSGLKPLDATATQLFTCSKKPTCGATSNGCPSPRWTAGACKTHVPGGSTVDASCRTTGTADISVEDPSISSTIWIYTTHEWMSELWFNPYTQSPNNLPTCS